MPEASQLEESYRKSIANLDIQRKSLETEADAIYLELTTPPGDGIPPMGVDDPLVDRDGYPRGDIDIYRARTLRQRYHIVQTDHKELMKQTEELLYKLAALKNPNKLKEEQEELEKRKAAKPKPKYDPVSGKWVVANWDGTVSGVKGGEQRSFDDLEHTSPATQANTLTAAAARNSKNPNNTNTASIPPKPTKPFARVDAVATGSPAQDAGLKEEDLIVAFGHLHIDNHNHLRAIAEMIPGVAANKESIPITVLRKEEGGSEITKHLDLAPQPWPGRGLIGCHIVPHKI